MTTFFDWITVAAFAMLAVLLLQRSVGPTEQQDKLYHYVLPALGCAVTNYLGNEGQTVAALAVFAAAIAYAVHFLKPFALH